jgi:hypothetical protein
MDNIINWPLLKHPMNWLTLILMVFIAAAAFHFVSQYVNIPTE